MTTITIFDAVSEKEVSLFYWSCSCSAIVRWAQCAHCGTAESKDSGQISIVPIQVEVLQILSHISAHSNTVAHSEGLRAVARPFIYNTETTVVDYDNDFAISNFKHGYYTNPSAVGAMSVLQWHSVRPDCMSRSSIVSGNATFVQHLCLL